MLLHTHTHTTFEFKKANVRCKSALDSSGYSQRCRRVLIILFADTIAIILTSRSSYIVENIHGTKVAIALFIYNGGYP